MKKIFFSVIALACSAVVSAQEAGEFRVGVTAGLNISSANLDADHSSKIGFKAGVLGEYNISEDLFLNAALQYSMRGVKDVTYVKYEWNPGYIELPIHIGYRYSFSDSFKGFVEAGPYFAYGVSGKLKDSHGNEVGLYDDDAKYVLGGEYNRFEFGVGGAVGVEYSSVQLKVGYDYGITKVCDLSNSARNSNFYVSLGYMF